ncbi:hypothetical protein SAMN02800687_3545 [Curtobacterium sp. UNCCL20]|nr:hypothetical protein SAMN02800687_3545 [Curtobacterium sp. UNCCL20]
MCTTLLHSPPQAQEIAPRIAIVPRTGGERASRTSDDGPDFRGSAGRWSSVEEVERSGGLSQPPEPADGAAALRTVRTPSLGAGFRAPCGATPPHRPTQDAPGGERRAVRPTSRHHPAPLRATRLATSAQPPAPARPRPRRSARCALRHSVRGSAARAVPQLRTDRRRTHRVANVAPCVRRRVTTRHRCERHVSRPRHSPRRPLAHARGAPHGARSVTRYGVPRPVRCHNPARTDARRTGSRTSHRASDAASPPAGREAPCGPAPHLPSVPPGVQGTRPRNTERGRSRRTDPVEECGERVSSGRSACPSGRSSGP